MDVGIVGGIIGYHRTRWWRGRDLCKHQEHARAAGTSVHGASIDCRMGRNHTLLSPSLCATKSIPMAHLDSLWRGPAVGDRYSQSQAAGHPLG